MTAEIVAEVEKRHALSPVLIRGALRLPATGLHVTVLFGPSGSGKTTMLRCLAGLERPDTGCIRFGEEVWFDRERGVDLGPKARGVGFLFQDQALFPHLNVAGNVGFALRHLPRAERERRVFELLETFGLAGLAGRWPRELSGGQRQRTALARALAHKPRLLLLDEPLSALDQPAREALRAELRRWLAAFAVPAVLVTHDRTEALALADQVVAMNEGLILQSGPVAEVFSRPANVQAARLLGVETVVPGRVVAAEAGVSVVDVGAVTVAAAYDAVHGAEVFVCVRAEDVILQKGEAAASSARNRLRGRITAVAPEGLGMRVTLDCGFLLAALVTRPALAELEIQPGDEVTALFKASAVHLIRR